MKTCTCHIQIASEEKIENFIEKKSDTFNIFTQNIDCGYTLETPRRGDSNVYLQSMFWIKNNKETRYTHAIYRDFLSCKN